MSKVTMRVLNPRAEIEVRTDVPQVSASPRLGNLDAKKIGILFNGKSGGEMLLPYVKEAIKNRVTDVEFRQWLVPFAEIPSVKLPVIKEVAEYSDGVIALMGD